MKEFVIRFMYGRETADSDPTSSFWNLLQSYCLKSYFDNANMVALHIYGSINISIIQNIILILCSMTNIRKISSIN